VQERYLPENLPFHHSLIAIRYSLLAAALMRRKFFGSAEALPSRKNIRHSLLATRCLSALTICR
jgi:hypothetical protein